MYTSPEFDNPVFPSLRYMSPRLGTHEKSARRTTCKTWIFKNQSPKSEDKARSGREPSITLHYKACQLQQASQYLSIQVLCSMLRIHAKVKHQTLCEPVVQGGAQETLPGDVDKSCSKEFRTWEEHLGFIRGRRDGEV